VTAESERVAYPFEERARQKQEGPFLGRAWLILLLEGLAFVGRIELAELILCQVLWKKWVEI
jgi:hypothetical protein